MSLMIMRQIFLKKSPTSLSPDKVIIAFASHVNYKSFDKNGRLQSNIKATSFENYQKDDKALFQDPHGLIYTKERIPWYIRANKGKALNAMDWIYLSGNVIMHQLPYPNHPETTIKTEAVTIHPATETAETDQHVLIRQLGNQVEGVGMKADMNKSDIDILSQSKGYYYPANSQD